MTAPDLPNVRNDAPIGRGHHPLRRALAWVVGAVVAVAALVVAVVLVLTNTDWGREQLRRRVVAALAGTVHGRLRIGRISGNLLNGATVHDVAITDSAGAPFFSTDSAHVRYALSPFLSKKILLDSLTLYHPDVTLDRKPGRPWNWAQIFPTDSTQPPSKGPSFGDYVVLHNARLVNGRVLVRTPYATPDSVRGVPLTATQKDSALRVALDSASRALVVAVPGMPNAYQRVQEYRDLTGSFPLVSVADPSRKGFRHVEVGSLQLTGLPFRPPAVQVRQARGAIDLTTDSLWFRNVIAELPASRATLTGNYNLNTGDLRISGSAPQIALADVRVAYPTLPAGQASADFRAALFAHAQQYTATNLALRLANPEGGQATAHGRVGLALLDSAHAPALRVDSTDLTFANFTTGLARVFSPTLKAPVEGAVGGHLAAAGSAEALRLNSDLTFDARGRGPAGGGRSRLLAAGGLGIGDDGAFRAEGLHVALQPLDVALARAVSPTLPVGGTLRGTATLDGSTLTALRAHDVDLTHVDRTGTSRVTGEVDVALAPAPSAPSQVAEKVASRAAKSTAAPNDSRGRAAKAAAAQQTMVAAMGARPTPARARRSTAASTGSSRLTRLDANLQLRPLSLATAGRFAPTAGLIGTVSGPVRARGSLTNVQFDANLRFAGPRGQHGGTLALRGTAGTGTVTTYDVVAQPNALDAAAISTKGVRTALSGTIAARGHGTDPATAQATVSADLHDLRVDTAAVDSLRARLAVGGGVLTVDTAAVRAPRAALDARGTFGLVAGKSGTLSYRANVDSLGAFARYLPRDTGAVAPRPALNARLTAQARADSAAHFRRTAVAVAAGDSEVVHLRAVDTVTAVRRDSVAGAVFAAGTVTGNVKRFDLRGRAGAEGVTALGSSVRHARVAYDWLGAPSTTTGALAFAVSADSVLASGFALDSADVRGTYRGTGGTVVASVVQETGRSYNARADYALLGDRKELRFADLRLRFDTVVYAATQPGAVRYGPRGLEVVGVELTNGLGGRIAIDGCLPATGPVDLRVGVTNFEVADALGIVESDVPFRGLVSLDARLTGTQAAPLLRAEAALTKATYQGTPVPDFSASADYADQRLGTHAVANIAYGVVVDTTYGRRKFLGLIGPRRVRIDTTQVASGRRQILDATASVPINLALQAPGGGAVTTPRLADAAPVTADIRLDSLPLDLAERFSTSVADVRGAANGTVAVRGTVKKPDVTGDVAVRGAQLRLVSTGALLQNLAATVRLRGDTVIIDSVAARAGTGTVRLAGGVGITNAADPTFALTLAADRARLLDDEQGRIDADARIAVAGRLSRPVVSGNARLLGGTIYVPATATTQTLSANDPAVFAVVDTSRLGAARAAIVPAQSAALDSLQADVTVGIDRDTWVRQGTTANVEIYSDGDLRVRADNTRQALVVDGVVAVERGEYEFSSKRFQIRRGTATFVGTQELDPNVQITAEYEVAQVGRSPLAIRIIIGGTLLAPKIALESDAQPPIPQTDLLSYLAFGNPTGSLPVIGGSSLTTSSTGASPVGAAAAVIQQRLVGAAIGIGVKQAQAELGRSLGADVINITPGGELAPEQSNGSSQSGLQTFLTGTQIEFGKYLRRNIYVGLQTVPEFWAAKPPVPGFRVQYRFPNSPNISLEAVSAPRYFLMQPTLAPQTIDPNSALGFYLVRVWRF
ncbi:MAG TPA: translocation/assembly module TamB [Gemmatirosa sp.]